MYRGNPHQDRNPFATKWRDRINTDSRPPFHGGGAIPLPKDTMPREPWTGRFGPLAELTQKQKDMMGSPYNTPDFGVSKEDLWDRTKGMEKKGFFGWGAQEPTTRKEFNDYYNQLEQGESGNWLANYSPGAGYPNEDFYLQDPFRDIDPSSLIFPEGRAGSDWDYNYRERRDDYDDRMYGPLWV
tara:strand:+ start:59 stop:610 length:552 start_codon:yes stop_codon:yes gene_type:complete